MVPRAHGSVRCKHEHKATKNMGEKKIIKAESKVKDRLAAIKRKDSETPIGAQERLSEIMNDEPRTIKVGKKDYKMYALRMGTQWLIAEEAVKIVKAENAAIGDVLKQFSVNIPSVVRCITLAILNDKDKIFKDERTREYTDEYQAMYDTIMWESDSSEWMGILLEVLNMVNVEVFFYTTDAVQMIREMTLKKKMTKKEAE